VSVGGRALRGWVGWFGPPQPATTPRADRRDRTAAACLAVAVFAVKWAGAAGPLAPWDLLLSPWHFGFEAGQIAGNLAAGHGFTIALEDGRFAPTAWMSPLYPLLLSWVFRAFGAFSTTSAHVVVAANCVLQALTAGLLYLLATRLGDRRTGLVAVAIFVLNPGSWRFLAWAWPTQLLALAILAHVDLLVRSASGRTGLAALCGASLGLAVLVDGAAIAFLPVSAAVLWGGARAARSALPPAAALVALLLVLAPWALRNQREFGLPNPLRGNTGVNLWVGNHPGARGESFHGVRLSPWHDRSEARSLAALGERGYDRSCRERALAQIAREPAEFVANSALRWSGFWLGEWWVRYRHVAWFDSLGQVALTALAVAGACRARRRGVGFAVAALLAFSLPYALTVHGHGRYRAPVEPILCLLGALALAGAQGSYSSTSSAAARGTPSKASATRRPVPETSTTSGLPGDQPG
jgi:4-amino-4-deoxy-L-arabinose transferase-like glycosyltransferase